MLNKTQRRAWGVLLPMSFPESLNEFWTFSQSRFQRSRCFEYSDIHLYRDWKIMSVVVSTSQLLLEPYAVATPKHKDFVFRL